jgi:phage terminase large subunit-like protein
MIDPNVAFTAVRASRGKVVRAEPKDARDKEPRALPQLRYCGRYRTELYNRQRPHQALANRVPMAVWRDGAPARPSRLWM